MVTSEFCIFGHFDTARNKTLQTEGICARNISFACVTSEGEKANAIQRI